MDLFRQPLSNEVEFGESRFENHTSSKNKFVLQWF